MAAKMRMTPDEVKREHREQEGDPLVRRRRRQRMRELGEAPRGRRRREGRRRRRQPDPLRGRAALRDEQDRAPRVVAKGRGAAAERIREMARAAGVPVLAGRRWPALLHKPVTEGRAIPANLYRAVAEVLAYVYRLRRRAR